MKTGTIIALGIGGYILYSLSKKINDARALNYEITGLNLGFSGGSIVLTVINPTTSSYVIDSIVADIYDNNNRIALISFLGQATILPGSTTNLTLPLKIDPLGTVVDLLQGASQLIFDKSKTANPNADKHVLQLNGTIVVQGFTIPFEQELTAFSL